MTRTLNNNNEPLTMNYDHHWYIVCLSEEIKTNRTHKVTLFEQNICLWRNSEGTLFSIDDACPHLKASLSLGKVNNDQLNCPFHGFVFNENGRCVDMPVVRGRAEIPKSLFNNTYQLREIEGWVFLYWGQQQAQHEPDFFSYDYPMDKSTTVYEWQVNYSQVIENQLDDLHVPIVHAKTLKHIYLADADLVTEVQGLRIINRPRLNGKIQAQYLGLIYPNYWTNVPMPKMNQIVVFVPTGPSSTRIYLQTQQAFCTWPIIGRLVTKLMEVFNNIVFKEDKQVVESQQQTDSDRGTPISYETSIIAYRKMHHRMQTKHHE